MGVGLELTLTLTPTRTRTLTAQEQFYFSDAVLVQLKSAVYLLKQVMAARDDRGSISVAFPDDGAAKNPNPNPHPHPSTLTSP